MSSVRNEGVDRSDRNETITNCAQELSSRKVDHEPGLSKEEVEEVNRKKRANQTTITPPVDGSAKEGKVEPPKEKSTKAPSARPKFNWRIIGPWDQTETEEDRKKTLEAASKTEEYVMDHLYGDWFRNTVIPIGVCFFSWAGARMGLGIMWLIAVLLCAASVYMAEFRRFNINVRDNLTRISAANRLEDEYETMEWLNSFLAKFWVIYMPTLSDTVKYQANEVLKDSAPGYGIEALSLEEFTLGNKAPRVDSVKSYTRKGKDHIEMDWAFSFTPNDTDDMTKNEIKKKINPKVALGVTVGKAFILKSLPILVEDMSFTGRMNIKLKLSENFPHVKMVSVQFLEPPVIDYALKPVGGDTFGLDIMTFIPGLSSFVNSLIHSNLRPMLYAPNSLDIDVEEIMSQQSNDSIGFVSVNIKRITDLRSVGDVKDNKFNPYVQLGLRNNSDIREKTKVKKATDLPVFLEKKNLLVNSLDGNFLVFDVFHMIPDKKDDLHLGILEVPLVDLLQNETQTGVVSNLFDSGRVVGKIEYDLNWHPSLKHFTLEDGTKEEYIDVQTGIMKLILHGAVDLDESRTVLGMLNPYAEVYINNKLVKSSRKLRLTNEPDFGLMFESLITEQAKTQIQVLVKDSVDGAVVGRLDTNLQDVIFETSRGQRWITAPSVTEGGRPCKFRISAKWRAVNVDDEQVEIQKNASIAGLKLHLVQAKGLKNLEAVGNVDPYVKIIQDGKLKGRTPVIPKTSDPVFNNAFFLPVANEHQHILLDIYDAETEGKDRSLGSCAVAVKDFLKKDENGYFLGFSNGEKLIEQPVLYNGTYCGTFYYRVSLIPTIPVYTRLQIENFDEYLELQKKEEELERKQAEADEELMKKNPGVYEWIEMEDDIVGQAPRSKLTLEDCLKHKSGNVVVHLLSGTFNKPDNYVHVLFDDQAFPSLVTPKIETRSFSSATSGEGFVRDMPNSKIVFRVSNAAEAIQERDVVAEKIFSTLSILKSAYSKPMTIKIDLHNSVTVQLEFVPLSADVEPMDTVLDVGHIKLDLIGAENLMAADKNGKSDPFCKVKLNGVEVHHTDKKKKTLNPVWDETAEFPVFSRTRDIITLEVYDWDLTHDSRLLGVGILDVSGVQPNETTPLLVKLDTQGTVNVKASFRPEFIRPKLSKKGGFPMGVSGLVGSVGGVVAGGVGAGGAVVGGVGGAVAGGVGGVVGGASGLAGSGVGAVSNGLNKGTGFLKGFGRKKNDADRSVDYDTTMTSDQISVMSHQTGRTSANIPASKKGQLKPSNGNILDRPRSPLPEASRDSIDQLSNISDFLPPPRPTGNHTRNVSGTSDVSSFSLTAFGSNSIPGRVNVVSAEGFKSSALEIKASVSTSEKTKDVHKTRATKAKEGVYSWNESFVFKAGPEARLLFTVREHHSFGRTVVIGSGEITLLDYYNTEDNVSIPIGDGRVLIHLRYMTQI